MHRLLLEGHLVHVQALELFLQDHLVEDVEHCLLDCNGTDATCCLSDPDCYELIQLGQFLHSARIDQ